MTGIIDKLTEDCDHTRKSLEEQRKRDEQGGAETVRLEHLKLVHQQLKTREPSPLARVLPNEAAKAKAIEESVAAWKNSVLEQAIKAPTSYTYEPRGPKPPDIQGPGNMFGAGRRPQPPEEVQAPRQALYREDSAAGGAGKNDLSTTAAA